MAGWEAPSCEVGTMLAALVLMTVLVEHRQVFVPRPTLLGPVPLEALSGRSTVVAGLGLLAEL